MHQAARGLTQISAAGTDTCRQRGFTLIEILVVCVIIGIVGVTALGTLRFGGNDNVHRDAARRVHVMLQLAADEALIKSQTLGLHVWSDGYQFFRREPDGAGEWNWSEYTADGKLTGQQFEPESSFFLDLELEAQPVALKSADAEDSSDEPVVPQLWFLPDGEVLPEYRLTVNAKQSKREYRIEPSPLGALTLEMVAQ